MNNTIKTIVNGLAIFAVIFSLVFCLNVRPFVIEIETYTEGYEISHMDKDCFNFYITARNDHDNFTIPVSSEVFGKYAEGEIIEVEVIVKEDFQTFKKYSILGYED